MSRLGEGGRGRKRALQYAEAGVETGVRLLEVADEALLAAVLAGETCLRAGGADQEAALCTADRTFGLKRTDTSNLLLLLNGGGGSGGGRRLPRVRWPSRLRRPRAQRLRRREWRSPRPRPLLSGARSGRGWQRSRRGHRGWSRSSSVRLAWTRFRPVVSPPPTL